MGKAVFVIAGLSIAFACNDAGSGGQTSNTGGSTRTGGAIETGGTTSSGGTTNTGSSTDTGGTSDTGGTNDAGGNSTTSGTSRTGGTTSTGSSSTGGKVGTGGGAGGGTGGSGARRLGGASGTAGQTGTAGGPGTSGGQATGGAVGRGGGTGAGGSTGGGGSVALTCDRTGLQAAVDSYLAAVEGADTSKMTLDSAVKYWEVSTAKAANTPVTIGDGLWKTKLPIKFSRSILDTTGCETFTELFITEGGHPYAIGTRLTVKSGSIVEIYALVTDSDDWNFDAAAYADCSQSESWDLFPPGEQSTREELIAAGEAYFKIFSDKSTVVPWGTPCYRLEGGKMCSVESKRPANSSCNVGIPDGINFTKTHWVVDVEMNAVVGITMFGGASPDSHLFQLEGGKLHYVHTLTVMK